MLHAIIMAGGAGTRFWPASRQLRPKQLLDLGGGRSMIQATFDRLGDMVDPERVQVITNKSLVSPIQEQLPKLRPEAVVGEPCKRDTAPCVGLAAILVQAADEDATMVVMPADHLIQPAEVFRDAVSAAVALVDEDPSRIVTFGIPPTYPAGTYGYIERREPLPCQTGYNAYRVARFREKPTVEVAQQYLDQGGFYWNGGIFVWRSKTILAALEKFQPEMHGRLTAIQGAIGAEDYHATLEAEFAAIDGTSIDYAVMEHYDNVVVLEAPFEWDDVGNWQSVARVRATDDDGNTLSGKHITLDTKDTIVFGSDEDHLIVTIGLDDCIVVHTPDATLVARKDKEEQIRQVVDELKRREWDEHL